MVRRYSSIIGTPLVDFNEGETLAFLRDVIIHPQTGKIEAFWVKPVGNLFENLIVQTQDILEWKKKIYIRSDLVMARAEEVVRIAEILAQQTLVVDQKVEGQSGVSYGKVMDLEFEDQTFYLKQIYSQKRFLSFFVYASYFFSFKRIIEITSEKILVDDGAGIKEPVRAPTLSEG